MTESEVQQLFVHHSFAEAKRMLIDECERNGHELLGHENVFELKALATQGAKSRNNSQSSQDFVQGGGNGEPAGSDPNAQGVVGSNGEGESAGGNGEGEGSQSSGGEGGEPEGGSGSGESSGEGCEGEHSSKQSQSQSQSESEGEGESNQQSQQKCESEQSNEGNPEGQPSPEGEPQSGEPKKKRRSRRQKSEGEGESEGHQNKLEENQQTEGEKTPEQLDAEANEKMKEAQELAKQAEAKREEQRKKAEEERKKREEEAAKNNRHHMTDEVVRRLKCLHKAFLVGPAGTGKSTLAMCACRELFDIKGSLEDVVKSDKFAQISFSPDTVTADMLGFTDVNGVFHETDIIRVFRDGGLILFDEMDDADASLLVKLNTMLANRVIPTPNGVVTQNENTYIVGTANTYGTGGNSMYVGRSRLDAATLDRWKMATIFVDYDTKLEAGIRARELDPKQSVELECVTRTIRDAIDANKWKQICSTRFVIDSCNMMKAGYKINQCVDTYLLSWEENNMRVVKSQIRDNLKNVSIV